MRSLTPSAIASPFARYSHGAEVPAGQRLVRTSGQLGMAADGSVPESAFEQAQICFASIEAILSEAGMTAADAFHVTGYVTDRAHLQDYMRARDLFLARVAEDALPASTLLIVAGFTRPEFKVEVEVSAAAP